MTRSGVSRSKASASSPKEASMVFARSFARAGSLSLEKASAAL